MKKILPLAGCIGGVLGTVGLICQMVWELPFYVNLLIVVCLFMNTAALIYNFRQINKKKKS